MKILHYVIIFALLLIHGCTPFLSTHQQFINSMDIYTHDNATIEILADERYSGFVPALKSDLIKIEHVSSGIDKYYYARLNTRSKYCYYYLIVDIPSQIVTGWGFTYDDKSKNKECYRSG